MVNVAQVFLLESVHWACISLWCARCVKSICVSTVFSATRLCCLLWKQTHHALWSHLFPFISFFFWFLYKGEKHVLQRKSVNWTCSKFEAFTLRKTLTRGRRQASSFIVSSLTFIINFLLLSLRLFCSSFYSSFKYKVLFCFSIWEFSCFVR